RGAAVQAVALVIDADVHRLQDHRHAVLLRDWRRSLQARDDVLVHLLLRHPLDVVAADHAHQATVQLLRHLAALVDRLDTLGVVFRFVQSRLEAQGRELAHRQLQPVARLGDGVDVLALPRPELHRGIAELRRPLQPLEVVGLAAEPHLDVTGEFRVLSLARQLALLLRVLAGGRLRPGREDRPAQKFTSLHRLPSPVDALRESSLKFLDLKTPPSLSVLRTNSPAAPSYSPTRRSPRSGPSTATVVSRPSAVTPRGAVTVTLNRPRMPTPVFGSTMCE